jgi:hypothetical protein
MPLPSPRRCFAIRDERLPTNKIVIAGLDPAIQATFNVVTHFIDARVKTGHDDG